MTPDDVLLRGRTALVTGAGAGIGRSVAATFARFGARVVVLEIDPETGERTAADIRAAGGDAVAIATDVRAAEQVARAIASCTAVDVLVNNAGGTFHAPFVDGKEKGWDALHRANLKSVMHCSQEAARRMIAQGRGGSIVNVVSIEAVRAAPGYAAYAAAKAGVISLTQTLAVELGPHRIRVNAIAPDICLTEGLRKLVARDDEARFAWTVPLGRAGDPDDIAGAAVFLASELARYVTGTTLHVDGGTNAAAGWYRDPTTGAWTLGPPRKA